MKQIAAVKVRKGHEDRPKTHPEGYKTIKHLASGGNGEAYLVERSHDKKEFVCKVARYPSVSGRDPEIGFLKDLGRHDRIVQMVDHVEKPRNIMLVLEYCRGGDLAGLIESTVLKGHWLSEGFVRHCFLQLAEALAYIHDGLIHTRGATRSYRAHSSTLLHCDIKPHNIFLRTPLSSSNRRPSIVLGDFGHSTYRQNSEKYTTPTYQPPELPLCTNKADVWAVGAVIHTLARGESVLARKPAQYKGDWEMEPVARQPLALPLSYSNGLNNIMLRTLTRDRNRRPNCIQLLDELLRL